MGGSTGAVGHAAGLGPPKPRFFKEKHQGQTQTSYTVKHLGKERITHTPAQARWRIYIYIYTGIYKYVSLSLSIYIYIYIYIYLYYEKDKLGMEPATTR